MTQSNPMRVAVYLPFVVPALLGACGPRLARTMRPALAAVVLVVAGVAATLTAMSALALLAFTWIDQLPVVADTVRWPRTVLRVHNPVATAVAVAAAAVLAGVIVCSLRTAVRHTRTAIDARRTCRTVTGCGADLVVVPHAEPTACAVGGRRGRIVVSTGMLAALGAAERRVLLAHERAHLDHRHNLYTALAAITAAANPLLGRLPAAVGLGHRTVGRRGRRHLGRRSQAGRPCPCPCGPRRHSRTPRSIRRVQLPRHQNGCSPCTTRPGVAAP